MKIVSLLIAPILLVLVAPTSTQVIGSEGSITQSPNDLRHHEARLVFSVTSPDDDTIVSASSSSSSMIMPHSMSRSKAQMIPSGIPLKAHQTRRLSVHGYHIMLMNLHQPLNEGQTVSVIVRFIHSSPLVINARVIKS